MPPWFAKVLETCESLSLDSPRDREILWERISEAWPREDMARNAASVRGDASDRVLAEAVIVALETA